MREVFGDLQKLKLNIFHINELYIDSLYNYYIFQIIISIFSSV